MTELLRDTGRTAGGERTTSTWELALLCAGFLAVVVAVVAAHRTPATQYEVSIFAGTPAAFWAGIALSIGITLVLTFRKSARWVQAGGALLAGNAFVAIVALPLLRGYEFYSSGDALSHMGWVRNVLANELALTDLIYPGLHTVGIYYHRLVGLPLESSLLLAVVTFATMFAVFVPMVVYTVTESRRAALIGLLSALMILPVNNISAHLTVFPSTMAVFYLPFVLLLLAVGIREASQMEYLTPTDGVLALACLSVVLIHPQQAANLLLVLLVVSLVVIASRLHSGNRSLTSLSWHSVILAGALGAWALVHERISETAVSFLSAVVATLTGGSSSAGSAISQRTGSLSAIGASPLEIALKLFLVSAIFSMLTLGVLAFTWLQLRRQDYRWTEIGLVGFGLFPIGVVMILYILSDLQTIYFRHLGFIMALVTVFGAVGVAWITQSLEDRSFSQLTVPLTAVVMGILIALSLVTLFPSPFIYQPNGHVTEMQLDGHATAFANDNDSVSYAGVRTGPDRFQDGIEGTFDLEPSEVRRSTRIPYDDEYDGPLADAFESSRYLVVSTADLKRESVAYQNLRYSQQRLETIGDGDGVDRVISNGEFRLYYVED